MARLADTGDTRSSNLPIDSDSNDTTPSTLLKTVRYEEAPLGPPPIPIGAPLTPSPKQSVPPVVADMSSSLRPMTAPGPRAGRVSQFSEDFKRDSGIDSTPKSPLSTIYASTSQQQASPSKGSVTDASPTQERKPRATLVRRRSKKSRTRPRSVSPPNFKRLSSFRGLETDIPTGELEDLDADNFGFSQRGSIFFGNDMKSWFGSSSVAGGNEPRAAPAKTDGAFDFTHEIGVSEDGQHEAVDLAEDSQVPPGTALSTDEVLEVPASPPRSRPRPQTKPPPADESPIIPSTPIIVEPQPAGVEDKAESPAPTRLVAGRRKPSVQMLQAAIAGGRVLSAEELTLSMQVRSMYEAGDEDAADWTAPSPATGNETPDTFTTKGSAEASTEQSSIARTRQGMVSRASRQSQDIRASYQKKHDLELAGGIEDWHDLDGGSIDRYGFILPKPEPGRPLSMVGAPEGLHRVATGLRVAADQPRRRGVRRTPSTARSSRSVPPQESTRPSSMHSTTSAATSVRSRRSTFRGKHRRITDTAGDMLTLPPGLADIAEKEDDGHAMAALRRREWSRNEKWQKMARPLQDSVQGSGGGMHFDFDTNDPKLISRTWKGIPDRWRATAWHSFLSASARRRGNLESDKALIQQFHQLQDTNCAEDYQIDVDVPRTISMHVMFRRRYRGGQRLLFRVLHAIALYFPETSYVQGMASLAATLLCYFDEERAFVMLVRLWQLRGLQQLFQPGFGGLMTALKDLEDHWLGGSDVAQKLNELSIDSTAFGTRWYLTLFNMSVPFPAQLRIWDVFMLLGDASPPGKGAFGGADLGVLHATSAALIDATREIIIDSDFENAMKVLTSFVPIRDEDLLMRVARAEYKMGKKRSTG